VASQTRGSEPVFIRSYEPGQDEDHLPRGLATTAFVYDNALAAIALVACGNLQEARLIGDALSKAARTDRTFHDGRIRNAYRAGPVGKGPPALPGWWDSDKKLWAEDPAQDGTATGNVAWAALALLTLHQATQDTAYLADAERLLAWITANAAAETAGFRGGFHGYDPAQVRLDWVSTEHNADVYAVATWLLRLTARCSRSTFSSGHGWRSPMRPPSGEARLVSQRRIWPCPEVSTSMETATACGLKEPRKRPWPIACPATQRAAGRF
jgi:hypothetical protein